MISVSRKRHSNQEQPGLGSGSRCVGKRKQEWLKCMFVYWWKTTQIQIQWQNLRSVFCFAKLLNNRLPLSVIFPAVLEWVVMFWEPLIVGCWKLFCNFYDNIPSRESISTNNIKWLNKKGNNNAE